MMQGDRHLLIDPAGGWWIRRPDGTRQAEPDPEAVARTWMRAGLPYQIRHVDWDTLAALPPAP